MQFRRATAFILSLIMILSVPLASANAVTYEEVIYTELQAPENRLSVSNGAADTIKDCLGDDYDEFREYLRDELIACNEQIDISSYNIPNTEAYRKALGDIVWNAFPEVFHVSNSMGFSVTATKVFSLSVSYIYTKSQYTAMYNEIEEACTEILSGISGNTSLTDVQKALLIHDRIAVLCEYDTDGSVAEESFTMYGVLVNEVAVCQGYSETYMYLLEKVGISSYICSSETLNHAWNIVEIDGEYYHVDITWDDPVQDIIGRVNHNNFLVSTKELRENGHEAYDFDATPSSAKYDNYFWENSEAAFQVVGDEVYYIDNDDEELKTYDGDELYSVDDTWYASNGGYWQGNYSRLGSDGKILFFTDTESVYGYNISTGKATKVFAPEDYGNGYNIYGFKYDDGEFICEIRNTPNKTSNIYIEKESYNAQHYVYTVTYNAYGGTVSPASASVTEGTSVTLPTPVKTVQITYDANGGSGAPSVQNCNLICSGWATTTDSATGEYSCGSLYTPTGNITLYAIWSKATVILDSSTPSRDGYNFLGWSRSADAASATYSAGGKMDVPGNITLYAVWEKAEEKTGFIIRTFSTIAGDSSAATVEIFKKNSTTSLYSFSISISGAQALGISELAAGDYTVVISKKNHVTKTCDVTIDAEHKGFDLQINPVGDVSGDGKVNTLDVARANSSAKGVSLLSGYELECADINGDGKVNTIDVAKINAHAKGVSSLWK